MTKDERRRMSAAYRVLSCQDEAQYRALDRLCALVGEVLAYELWLTTKPDPKLVEAVLSFRLLSGSPLRQIVKRPPSLIYPVTLTRRVTQ